MLKYSINASDLKIRIKEIGLSQIRHFLIIGGISAIFTIYFLVVGFLFDKEMLINGFSLLFISVFMVVIAVIVYNRYKQQAIEIFKKSAVNGVVDYIVIKQNDVIQIDCVSTKRICSFNLRDIYKIYFMKNVIVVKLKSKKIVDLPNIPKIRELFN